VEKTRVNVDRRPRTRHLRLLLAAFLTALLTTTVVAACGGAAGGRQPADGPVDLAGEEIELLVGVGPGGGYDTWARQLATYMEKYLPGNPSVVVRNVTGAGGGVMLNQLFSAEPDGTSIAITNLAQLALYKVTGTLPIDPTNFTMVGQVADEKKYFFAGRNSAFTSVDALRAAGAPVPVALVGLSGGGGVTTIAFFDELDTPWQPVTHDGSSEAVLSVVRGDTEGLFVSADSVVGYVETGDLVPIFYTGTEDATDASAAKLPALADVPNAGELGLESFSLVSSEARGFIAPPGMQPELQAAFEQALAQSVADPGFVTWLEESGSTLDLLSAADTQAKLGQSVTATERYADVLKQHLQ
jgi:putative tricarboxylic transport membrane protein